MKTPLHPGSIRIYIRIILAGVLLHLASSVVLASNSDAQQLKNSMIQLSRRNHQVDDLLHKIERQSKFVFTYEGNLFIDQEITLSKNSLDLETLLKEISQSTNLRFKQINYTISVKGKASALPVEELKAIQITGTVRDQESGEPLPGVNIIVKGTSRGTVTDIGGNFILDVDPGQILILSYIGYDSQEITVVSAQNLNIDLIPSSNNIEEFVVVGYGTVQRKEMTGSVSSITRKDIISEPIYSFENLLQGKAAGVDVVADSYRPGAGSTVRIRGARSLVAGNDPLIVMDGIPIEGNLMDINPSDIESIEILKDASATAIYGSRGSNGVILITTRGGFAGATQIEYSAFAGIQRIANRVDLMNANQYTEMQREAARQDGSYTNDEALFMDWEMEAIRNGVDTDWQREVFQTGLQQNHQLSVRGGTEDTKYAISGTYLDHQSILDNNDFSRFVGRVNLDQRVNNRLRAGVSSQVTYSKEHRGGNIRDLLLGSPLDYPERGLGALSSEFAVGESFPVLALNRDLVIDRRDRTRIIANFYAEVEILEGLSFRFNFAPDLTYYERGTHTWQTSTAGVSNSRTSNILFENIINYNKSFGNNHKIRATGLYSVQTMSALGNSTSVRGLPFEQQRYHNIGTAEETTDRSSFLNEWALESYMLRVNYGLLDKYMFTLTGRVDGSSRLAEGNKYGLFPSVGFAWLVDQEGFFKRQHLFDEIKFRASYGDVGNTGINPYQTQGRVGRVGYSFGDQSVFGFQSLELANSDLRWERTRQLDLGIDFGVWNNRISGTVGVYQQNTIDLLMNRQLPPTSGFASVLENIGSTRNRGLEFNLSIVNIESRKAGGLRWVTDLVFHTNRNQITELYGGKEDDPGNGWFIGQPINVYYDWKFEGIWQESEREMAIIFGQRPGDMKLSDINQDGKIDANDRMILGSDVPSWTGSINNRINYKNFDLAFFIYTTQGVNIYSEAGGTSLGGMINLRRGYNLNSRNVDYWTPENPSNEFPQPRVRGHAYSTPMAYFDASFVRVRNITLGYSLPATLVDRMNISRMRTYAGVQNPFTFTDFPGLDPEGARNHDMPNYRTFLLGLEVAF